MHIDAIDAAFQCIVTLINHESDGVCAVGSSFGLRAIFATQIRRPRNRVLTAADARAVTRR
jgi:hypothetical protein